MIKMYEFRKLILTIESWDEDNVIIHLGPRRLGLDADWTSAFDQAIRFICVNLYHDSDSRIPRGDLHH